jgi:hypothetical protein
MYTQRPFDSSVMEISLFHLKEKMTGLFEAPVRGEELTQPMLTTTPGPHKSSPLLWKMSPLLFSFGICCPHQGRGVTHGTITVNFSMPQASLCILSC